jgi:hypothetical protein
LAGDQARTCLTRGGPDRPVNKADAKEIADAIRVKLGRPAAATTVQAASSDADELAKWARLRDSGVISAEDFEAKKRQLLGSERRVTTNLDLRCSRPASLAAAWQSQEEVGQDTSRGRSVASSQNAADFRAPRWQNHPPDAPGAPKFPPLE